MKQIFVQCGDVLRDREKKNVIIPGNCPASHWKFIRIDSKTAAYFPQCTLGYID